MRGSAELREQAESKRRVAELARRAGDSLLATGDRVAMLQHAQELAGLEAQARALDAQRKKDKPVA